MTSIAKPSHERANLSAAPPQVEPEDAGLKASASKLKQQAVSSVPTVQGTKQPEEPQEPGMFSTVFVIILGYAMLHSLCLCDGTMAR